MVIPRRDAPPASASNWIGFARLSVVSDVRADIVEWATMDNLGIQPPLAPAFLISEAMPFEFPRKMDDLFYELAQRGVPLALLIAALRLAVLLNRETDPLFVVLGTPMRGVAGSAERKFHLAAWYVEPSVVRGLRLTLLQFDPDPRLQQLGEELEQVLVNWLKTADVNWCLVREDRPEIVTPRDRGSALAWFKGKAVSVWGCALGSHVAELLTRAGARRIVLRDKGIVTPGILARQLYSDGDIGKFKVEALSARLKAIRPDIEIEEHCGDLLSGPLAVADWTDSADVVIETAAAGGVMAKIEAVRRQRTTRRGCLHDALAAATTELRTHVADHLIGGRNPLQHLRDVLAQAAQLATALRAGIVLGHVHLDLAWKMIGQCAAGVARLRIGGLRSYFASLHTLGLRGLQIFQPQFQLLDLLCDLLRGAPEQHPAQLLKLQLQILHFIVARAQLFVGCLQHRPQHFRIEHLQIGERAAASSHGQEYAMNM
jgi:hypothetical protein